MADELDTNAWMSDGYDETGRFRPSRRTVVAAAAWSVPVIAVASIAGAAPAMAASPGVITFVADGACKHPGNSQKPFNQDYHFTLLVKNTTGAEVAVVITAVYIGTSEASATLRTFSVGPGVAPVNTTPKPFNVPASAGSTGIQYIIHGGGDNSANSYVRIEYTYQGVAGTLTTSTLVSPPCTVTT